MLPTKTLFLFLFVFVLLLGCQNDPTPSANPTTTPNTETAPSVSQTNEQESPKGQTTSPKKGFGLYVEDQKSQPGQEICLDVTVHDFNQIVSMQYTMNWNPNVLKFEKFGDFQLKDLGESNFNIKTAPKGMIPISWYDQDIKGITLADNTSIYQICFEVIGDPGSSSRFILTNDPVTIEISDASGQLVELNSRRAKVEVQ